MEHEITRPGRGHSSWFHGVVLAIACLGFGLALSGYAATGAYSRYSGDDYCYSAVLAEHGFWQTQTFAYQSVTTYAGNRYSVNLVAAIGSMVGPFANAVLPGLILLLWIGGMTWFLGELHKAVQGPRHPLEWLLASGAVAFFVLQTTPNISQSFYWSSGLLTYLLPITVNSYLASLILNRIRSSSYLPLASILVLIFSFLSAGFSETVAALQAGITMLALLAAWWSNRVASSWFSNRNSGRRAIWLISAALLGTLFAMSVLALSPANHLRQSALPQTPGLLALVKMSLYNAYIFTRVSISKQFWTLVVCSLLFLGLGWLSTISLPTKSRRLAHYLAGILALAAASYLLVVCTMAPSVYAESSYPDLRVLIVPWWIIIIESAGLGWLTGQTLSRWFLDRPYNDRRRAENITVALSLSAYVVVLAISALPITASQTLFTQLPRYQRWARYWDMRNTQIWQASHANVGRVEIMQIDHIIQDVSDLSPNPAFWYNVCAARYYGVKQIVADLPGWDK